MVIVVIVVIVVKVVIVVIQLDVHQLGCTWRYTGILSSIADLSSALKAACLVCKCPGDHRLDCNIIGRSIHTAYGIQHTGSKSSAYTEQRNSSSTGGTLVAAVAVHIQLDNQCICQATTGDRYSAAVH